MENCQCHPHKIFFVLLLGILFSIGISLGGFFIGRGLWITRTADRYVSVKGLAEMQVKANLAIWDIDYKVAGDDLPTINNQIVQNQKSVMNFLQHHGFVNDEIEAKPVTVLDQYAKEYYSEQKPPHRYILSGGVRVRTNRVELAQQVSGMSTELIKDGVALVNSNSSVPNPRYVYTQLDSIRPPLLEQATKSARAVAQQFASDSHSQLGGIRKASQGVFQILSADNSGPIEGYSADIDQLNSIQKTVRVVSSIDYFLQN